MVGRLELYEGFFLYLICCHFLLKHQISNNLAEQSQNQLGADIFQEVNVLIIQIFHDIYAGALDLKIHISDSYMLFS